MLAIASFIVHYWSWKVRNRFVSHLSEKPVTQELRDLLPTNA
jgi:hypothetical protein